MKICKKCQASELVNKFEHGRAICKICRATQNAEFYQKNENKIRLAKKEYRGINKETISEKAKEIYQQNRLSILTQKAIYYKNNRETILSRSNEYYKSNKERIIISKAAYAKKNADKLASRNAKRRAVLIQACPQWLSIKQLRRIEAFYRLAKYLTKKSNTPHEVDHIVPLKGKNVNGLHAPWNLQILTRYKNRQKSNRAGKS